MTTLEWWVMAAVAAAVWCAIEPPLPRPPRPGPRGDMSGVRLAALALGAGMFALLVTGTPVLGLAVAVLAGWWLRRSSVDPRVPRAAAARHDLPHLVTLMVGPLHAGDSPAAALAAACTALGGPAAEGFAEPLARLGVGVDPVEVWREVARDPEVGDLGRALGRAHRSGAAVGEAVERLATELAQRSAAERENNARTIGVRAALPLGVCLLPAFLLLGVVPLAVGLFSSALA